MRFADLHLDLAYKHLRGQDVSLPAASQAKVPNNPAVGIPDLIAGGVDGIGATLFAQPHGEGNPKGFTTPEEAQAEVLAQIGAYEDLAAGGLLVLPGGTRKDGEPRAILLLEGADAVTDMSLLGQWRQRGLRAVGLTWNYANRFAAGCRAEGGLSADGRDLVRECETLDIIIDVSHLNDASCLDVLSHARATVIASHSNCRAITPGRRQLTDDMIRAIAATGGVIGINLYSPFLAANGRATIADVVAHIEHVVEVTGSARHCGFGTDMDGGFGAENLPQDLVGPQSLSRVAQALRERGWSNADVEMLAFRNWHRVFAELNG